jgi:hypothetical protein
LAIRGALLDESKGEEVLHFADDRREVTFWYGVGVGENGFRVASVDTDTIPGKSAETSDGFHAGKLGFYEVEVTGDKFGGQRLGGGGESRIGGVF